MLRLGLRLLDCIGDIICGRRSYLNLVGRLAMRHGMYGYGQVGMLSESER